jgi:hypothetical protein
LNIEFLRQLGHTIGNQRADETVKRLLLSLTLLCLAISAHAAPTTNIYDVEVIVFENKIAELEGQELWTTDRGRATPPESAGIGAPGGMAVGDTPLKNALAALEKDGHYRVLVHQRWRQAAEERSASKPVWLRNVDGQMEGSFRFYMSRFLHVDVDLALRDTDSAAGGVTYRLTEHRRVKTQELQYFDHPKLGVLVRITQAGKE